MFFSFHSLHQTVSNLALQERINEEIEQNKKEEAKKQEEGLFEENFKEHHDSKPYGKLSKYSNHNSVMIKNHIVSIQNHLKR